MNSDLRLRQMKKNNDFHIENIVASEICVDPSYMQNISKKHVKRLIDHWDDKLVAPPKVSKRNGKYFVFDGQHTIEAIKEKYGEATAITCLVYDLASPQDEYLMRTAMQNPHNCGHPRKNSCDPKDSCLL